MWTLASIGGYKKAMRSATSSYAVFCGKKLRELNDGVLSITNNLHISHYPFLRERRRRKSAPQRPSLSQGGRSKCAKENLKYCSYKGSVFENASCHSYCKCSSYFLDAFLTYL